MIVSLFYAWDKFFAKQKAYNNNGIIQHSNETIVVFLPH